MRNYVPCNQGNKGVSQLRKDQEQRFHDYQQTQRRTNPRYYDFQCHLKYDFIIFSAYLGKKKEGKQDPTQLYPLLNDLLEKRTEPPDFHRNRHDYDLSMTYNFNYLNKKYELNVACASKQQYKPYLLKIHDPTEQVLRYLQKYLDQVTYYHTHSIEFTYDFYSKDNDLVRNFIKRHVVVSWRGKQNYHPEYEKSFYGNNIRFARGKGLRAYEKEEEKNGGKQEFVRLEMLLKRSILKSNGIHDIDDVIGLDSRIPNKYFSFKTYNYSKLKTRVADSSNWKGRFDELKNNIQSEIEEGYLYEVNKHSLNWYKRYYSDSYLKVTKYWKHFTHQFRGSSFLNGDSFMLSLLMMEDEF
jgi:hypothetical protein